MGDRTRCRLDEPTEAWSSGRVRYRTRQYICPTAYIISSVAKRPWPIFGEGLKDVELTEVDPLAQLDGKKRRILDIV